jgi:hypothetical protein
MSRHSLITALALLGLLVWAYSTVPPFHQVLPAWKWDFSESTVKASTPHNVIILDGKQSGHDGESTFPLMSTAKDT